MIIQQIQIIEAWIEAWIENKCKKWKKLEINMLNQNGINVLSLFDGMSCGRILKQKTPPYTKNMKIKKIKK